MAALLLVLGALVVSGATRTSPPGARTSPESHDPRSARALLRIARSFNDNYQHNRFAAVYARWDATSRAVVSRRGYLARHRDCPNDPHVTVDTWGVTRGPGRAWLVHYTVGGQQLTDWWYYAQGRFVFDLTRSNPSAVALYRSPPARFAQLTGCAH